MILLTDPAAGYLNPPGASWKTHLRIIMGLHQRQELDRVNGMPAVVTPVMPMQQ